MTRLMPLLCSRTTSCNASASHETVVARVPAAHPPAVRLASMGVKLWTAAELENLTPAERHKLFEARVITDLEQAPPALVARARARVEQLIAEAQTTQPG